MGRARESRPDGQNDPVSMDLEVASGWLTRDELEQSRERLPMVYVDVVPVRVDALGQIAEIALLLRAMPDGSISRALVSGRVLYGERVRDALIRHLEKDLGPMAMPRLPVTATPFQIVEYFPDPSVTGFHDPRQHAVSLAYIVPVDGDCQPSQDALDLAWVTPAEAATMLLAEQMTGGHDRLLRMALAHAGQLP